MLVQAICHWSSLHMAKPSLTSYSHLIVNLCCLLPPSKWVHFLAMPSDVLQLIHLNIMHFFTIDSLNIFLCCPIFCAMKTSSLVGLTVVLCNFSSGSNLWQKQKLGVVEITTWGMVSDKYNMALYTMWLSEYMKFFFFFLRCNFEAWIYIWDSPSGEHEVTSWSDWLSVGNGKSHVLPLCDLFIKPINILLPSLKH